MVPVGSDAERAAYMERVSANLLGGILATDDQALDSIVRMAGASPAELDQLACRFAPRAGPGRELVRWMLGEAVAAARRAEPIGTPAAVRRAEREGLDARRAAQFRLLNLAPVVVWEEGSVSLADTSEATVQSAMGGELPPPDDAPDRRWRGPGWRKKAANTFLALGMNRCLSPGCSTELARDATAKLRRRRHYCSAHSEHERYASNSAARWHDARLEAVVALLGEAAPQGC